MKVDIKIDPDRTETAVIVVAKEMTDEVVSLARNLQAQALSFSLNGTLSFVVGFSEGSANVIPVDKAVRFFAVQKSVLVETYGHDPGDVKALTTFTVKLRLYELEERLPAKQFVRISHSEIINLKMVKNFDLSFAGSIQVRFINGTTTFVSRRYVAVIKKTLGL